MTHFGNLLAQQLSPGIKQEILSPAKMRIVTTGGLPYEAFGPTGTVKPWHVLRFVESTRSLAFYPLHKSGDEAFLNMNELFKTSTLFQVSVRLDIAKDMYNNAIPKTPLTLETQLVYVGKTSKNVQTDILLPSRGITLATCQIQGVLVDLKSRHPVPFPDWWRAKYARYSVPGRRLKVNVQKCPVKTNRNDQELNEANKTTNSATDLNAYSSILDAAAYKMESKNEPTCNKTESFPNQFNSTTATSCSNIDASKLENKIERNLNKDNETANFQNCRDTNAATFPLKRETSNPQNASIPSIPGITFKSQPSLETGKRVIGSAPKIGDVAFKSQLNRDTDHHPVESDSNISNVPFMPQRIVQTEKTQDQSVPNTIDIAFKSEPNLETEKMQGHSFPKTFDVAFKPQPKLEAEHSDPSDISFNPQPNLEIKTHPVESAPRITCVEQTVYPSDLDANAHVNWTVFLKYCLDALATEDASDMSDFHALKSADISYVGEGLQDQRLRVKFWKDSDVPCTLHFHIVDSESNALINYARLQFYSLTELSHTQSRL